MFIKSWKYSGLRSGIKYQIVLYKYEHYTLLICHCGNKRAKYKLKLRIVLSIYFSTIETVKCMMRYFSHRR